jgi:hypothetical protein
MPNLLPQANNNGNAANNIDDGKQYHGASDDFFYVKHGSKILYLCFKIVV